ncbi:MAG TPA: peptidoglycan bridge formation glycyltransferase FemA/FemB family protein [Candidatus Saccharimonadales bacterium]|nr:peptidoglycan bridge formation glycyltransferase FemA/FemB family protein [Candidatus Saccharimonadales bacterium]
MNVRFADDTEIKNWNKHILLNPDGGNVVQGYEFAQQKKAAGWTIRYIMLDSLAMTIMEKRIPYLGKVWYAPKGPGVSTLAQLKQLREPLIEFARKEGVFTIKIEPELPHTASLDALDFTKTRPVQQNYATVLVDISPDLETIIKNFPQKGRHAIRRAERDGVTVKKVPATDENCLTMYMLLKETATDAQFGIRPSEYYKTFYQRYEAANLGQLFFAEYEGQVVAGAFAIHFGKKSMYKDGASIRKRTAYGASHLLQWHVITWAKEHGAKIHDLCGAPPIARSKDPSHPYYGIGLFKTSFNKEITEYVGAYEIPVQHAKSKLWTKYIEKIIRRLYYKKHHESYY